MLIEEEGGEEEVGVVAKVGMQVSKLISFAFFFRANTNRQHPNNLTSMKMEEVEVVVDLTSMTILETQR